MRTEPDLNTNRHHLQQNTHILNAMFASQHETRSTHFPSISNTKSPADNGNFIQLDPYDVSSTIAEDTAYPADAAAVDEARYNLATRVMSNGVEVIIAGDKTGKGSHKSNALRILPSLSHKPMTLAPSTLKDQMILVMPSDAQENYTISINSNNFITKTCLTTYTYRTTYLQDGQTTVESREKVVSNTATEERNYFKISPTGSLGVTLSRTPELAVGVFHTTYTYYNTILDGDLPIVLSSQHILTNTITGPDDYISFLQPSEEATPVHETNTYFSSISLTKTLKESNIEKIVSTSNLLTQVVITESLPPRSTAVMTSYIAFDSDETGIQNKFAAEAPTSSNHIQNVNPSKDSEIENFPDTDGAFKSDIHIYATKTYLTTFTYLTTLINTQVSATPTTLVNFHTRVIENVITESIPSDLIQAELLSKFENHLKSKNRESYVTMLTLPTGQSLEITAVNLLHSTSTEKTATDSTKKPANDAPALAAYAANEETNEALDSETGSSENDEQYVPNPSHTNTQKNNTKVSDTNGFPSVNQIIETFNFNRLQALGPVFNAMAGLIQNNFGGHPSSNELKKNLTAVNVESKHSTKNITAYDTAQTYEGPIYIPVQNVQNANQFENPDNLKVTGQIAPQHLHLTPPRTDWFASENQNHIKVEHIVRKPTYETPLLNGGIPISPGEVITANSDVIVGKPNGIQPRIPDVGNALLPPPPPPQQPPKLHLPVSPNTYAHLKQTKAIPRPIPLDANYDKETNYDGILKPPPLKPPYPHQKPQIPHNILSHNYRLNYAAEQHMHPVQQQQQQQYQLQQHIRTQQPPYNEMIQEQRPPPNKRIVPPQSHNYILYRPHDYDTQPHLNKKTEADLNKELYNNEILEIRKIPEVYSTDLPGRESAVHSAGGNFTNFKTQIKKVVGSNKPMLVDIKPSQITNIVIPRDNAASILIVESDVEPHKNGQYYDEPPIYKDEAVTDHRKYLSKLHKPIVSNQQVNLDTNVLSHNVDINVPPITFNKDTDFPHSTPVRGQISRKEASNFHMPHITIPITDNQIQVNLTPHNTLTQKIIASSFSNNMDPANGPKDKYITQSFQNAGPIRYLPTSSVRKHNAFSLNATTATGPKQNFDYSPPTRSAIKRPGATRATPVFHSVPAHTEPAQRQNGNFNLNKDSEPFFAENAVRRPTYYVRQPEGSLSIYPNVTTTRPTNLRPTFNPAPLLHLFYGLHSNAQDENTEAHQPSRDDNILERDENFDDDDDINATEDSYKLEDQKVSSSVNIAVPLQNKVKKAELRKAEVAHQSELNSLHRNVSAPKTDAKLSGESPKTPLNSSLPFGSESYLDSSSVNAVNNMRELNIPSTSSEPPPPPSASFISPNKRPMSIGKPFSKIQKPTIPLQAAQNNSKSPQQANISINTGEGFKLRTEDEGSQPKPAQSATKESENREKPNNQTENPFKSKVTKNTKKPSKPTANRFQPTPTTKIVPPPAPPPQKTLNKLEFQNQLHTNHTQHRVKDSSEVFDSYESINPHNHNYINLTNNESATVKTLHQQHENRASSAPIALDIRPPPISPLKPEREDVVGLMPPPTRTAPVARPSATSSAHFPLFIPTGLTTKRINASHQHQHHPHPHPHQPTNKHSYATTSTSTKVGPISYTRTTLRLKQKTSEFLRPSHTTKIYATPSSSKIRTSPTIAYVTPVIEKIPSGIVVSSKVSSSAGDSTQAAPSKEKTLKPTTSTTIQEITAVPNSRANDNQILTLNQEIPDEILVERSEVTHRRRPSITRSENQTIIYQERPSATESPFTTSKPSMIPKNTRTSLVIPTKSVTNTRILTITTTKTSVVTSLGVPSTQTLTLTKTHISTLIDTVTETHTLLRPSKTNEVLHMTPTKTMRTDEYSSFGGGVGGFGGGDDFKFTEDVNQDVGRHREDTTPITTSIAPITTPNDETDSILVVMTDKKSNGGVFSIIPSMIDTPHNINAIGGGDNDNSIGLDYDENITFNLPTRDEDVGINEVNHVLLGGVLIATPPKANDNSHSSMECRPSCKATRNEICQLTDNRMACVCRPGFARMFPDRPCRPTYTYAMQIPIHRISKQALHFKEQYRQKDSDEFKQLAGITHDAVDRMIMQSDLRDVYHGVHVTSFDAVPEPESENGVLGKFLIQLSDNSDENRLVDVFRKYLRQHNFSLGGTEIFTTKTGVNSLEIIDFDECAHSQFHDCSENSRCFNLQGTYTCSCQEGYIDLSENAIYPGRICSAEIVGCEQCHYNGKCIQEDKSTHPICECFHWYTGASCQVNLKILLLALVTVGTILFIMLLICVLLTCAKKKKHHNMQSLMSGIHIIAPRNSRLSSKYKNPDKRAMIKDSGSETSQNSVPYTLKDAKKQKLLTPDVKAMQQQTLQHKQTLYRNINKRGQPSLALISTLSEMDRRHEFTDQADRSLTVMIPRAKYHHSLPAQGNGDDNARTPTNNEAQLHAVSLETETKSNYQCSLEKKPNATSKKKPSNIANHGALHTSSTGALVSAGFEVSATVGNTLSEKSSPADTTSALENRCNELFKLNDESHVHSKAYQGQFSQYNTYKNEEKFIDSMDVWLDTIQQNELTAEARSFDETTIQAPTKSFRSVYDRQMGQINTNDEANTMAERDVGSTFLLPHTHLYKPDRDSDISGFDSI